MDDNKFKIVSKYQPTGDQPEAIKKLIEGVKNNKRVHSFFYICISFR